MNYTMNYRRTRLNRHIRNLTAEVNVSGQELIQPLFYAAGLKSKESIQGLTGVFRDTEKTLLQQIESDVESGTEKFILFGVPSVKMDRGFNSDETSRIIGEIKRNFGEKVFLSVDVCLCSYTTHGHCGVMNHERDHVENDATVHELANLALSYAQAGADCVAPSDMMDGRIRAIRTKLDQANYEQTILMSYSAKFNSKFYGPFRLAADSAPKGQIKLKDRSSYQIDPRRPNDALLSSLRDAQEGADILMVKPGLPYLDVLSLLSKEIKLPWAVYEVSGEYAAIELMAEAGLINAEAAHMESWISLKRAGASMIITYGARRFKNILGALQ